MKSSQRRDVFSCERRAKTSGKRKLKLECHASTSVERERERVKECDKENRKKMRKINADETGLSLKLCVFCVNQFCVDYVAFKSLAFESG